GHPSCDTATCRCAPSCRTRGPAAPAPSARTCAPSPERSDARGCRRCLHLACTCPASVVLTRLFLSQDARGWSNGDLQTTDSRPPTPAIDQQFVCPLWSVLCCRLEGRL